MNMDGYVNTDASDNTQLNEQLMEGEYLDYMYFIEQYLGGSEYQKHHPIFETSVRVALVISISKMVQRLNQAHINIFNSMPPPS